MTTNQAPAFVGWPANTYEWLAELAENNNKPWFTDNRATYDQMRSTSMSFAENLASRLGSEGEVKVWRIHKDARFSKGGDPYKVTHDFGVFDNGWMDGMRIESTGVTVALGSYAWSKEQLVRYREAVVDAKKATELVQGLAQAADAGFGLDEPELKRPLKDLPEDHPDPDLTRHKGLFLTKSYPKSPKWIFKPAALDRVADDAASVPLLRAWMKANVL